MADVDVSESDITSILKEAQHLEGQKDYSQGGVTTRIAF
jgi:hypothetical protein